jgi:hypothetical protein
MPDDVTVVVKFTMTARQSDDEGREAASLASLQRQLAQLTQRVEWVEKALEQKRSAAPASLSGAEFKRQMAEMDARRKAIDEFVRRGETPEQRARQLAYREELNAHLKTLGFDPLQG